MKQTNPSTSARLVARMGLLFALALTFGYVESLFSSLLMLPPGVKLGLSNVVVMFCLLDLGVRPALLLAVLKALSAFVMRGGFTAGLLSLSGGLVSIAVMALLLALFSQKLSRAFVSICGAVAHNIGQLAAAWLLLGNPMVLYYLPVLMVSGVVMGLITALLLKVTLPLMKPFVPRRQRGGAGRE